jgi:hypothetical protein
VSLPGAEVLRKQRYTQKRGRELTNSPIDGSQLKALRNAASLYLLLIISAPIGLLYVPSRLIVPGDATATADNFHR